mgnify:FL=1
MIYLEHGKEVRTMAKPKRKPMRRPKKNRTDRSEALQTLLIINAILVTVKTILEIIEKLS